MSQDTVSLIQVAVAGPKAATDIHHLPSPPPILDSPHSCPTRQLVYLGWLPDWVIYIPGRGFEALS